MDTSQDAEQTNTDLKDFILLLLYYFIFALILHNLFQVILRIFGGNHFADTNKQCLCKKICDYKRPEVAENFFTKYRHQMLEIFKNPTIRNDTADYVFVTGKKTGISKILVKQSRFCSLFQSILSKLKVLHLRPSFKSANNRKTDLQITKKEDFGKETKLGFIIRKFLQWRMIPSTDADFTHFECEIKKQARSVRNHKNGRLLEVILNCAEAETYRLRQDYTKLMTCCDKIGKNIKELEDMQVSEHDDFHMRAMFLIKMWHHGLVMNGCLQQNKMAEAADQLEQLLLMDYRCLNQGHASFYSVALFYSSLLRQDNLSNTDIQQQVVNFLKAPYLCKFLVRHQQDLDHLIRLEHFEQSTDLWNLLTCIAKFSSKCFITCHNFAQPAAPGKRACFYEPLGSQYALLQLIRVRLGLPELLNWRQVWKCSETDVVFATECLRKVSEEINEDFDMRISVHFMLTYCLAEASLYFTCSVMPHISRTTFPGHCEQDLLHDAINTLEFVRDISKGSVLIERKLALDFLNHCKLEAKSQIYSPLNHYDL